METKHTPGPWYHVGGHDARKAPFIRAVGDVLPGTMSIAQVSNRGPHSEHIANALLIAAAPELLATLNGLLDRYVELVNSGDAGNWDCETEGPVIAARAAIAKATGSAQ